MARRRGFWIPFSLAHGPTASTTSMDNTDALAFISSIGITTRRDMTIARIRGTVHIVNNPATDQSQVDVSIALMVIQPGQDLAITSLLSGTVTSPIWRLDTVTTSQTLETASGVFEAKPDVYIVDTKAMRKLDRSNNELRLVSTIGAGSNITIKMRGVVYVLEP